MKVGLRILLLVIVVTTAQRTAEAAQSMDSDSLTLYLFLSDECVITQYYVPTLNEIHAQYGDEVGMLAIFPNFSSKPSKIEGFYDKYGLTIPHRTDYYKDLSRKLGATITPEAILVDQQGKILYQGQIDNSYVRIGKRRRVVTTHDLSDALLSATNHQEIKAPKTEAIGCFINFRDKISRDK